MKKILVTAATRYEPDIIESFCRYYLSFADGILLYEGAAHTDNTLDILDRLKSEGLAILPYSPPPGSRDVDIPSAMVDAAFLEHGADVVLPLDPDEFLFHVDGLNPREELEKLPSDLQVMLEWETYVYDREPEDDSLFLPDYFTERRVNEARPQYKTALSREFYLKYRDAVTLLEGRHGYVFAATDFPAPHEKGQKLRLAHYPLRSMSQAMSKVITGRLYYISRRMPDSQGRQWVDLFERVKQQGALSHDDLREFSLYYGLALDQKDAFALRTEPLPATFFERPKLKYTFHGQSREDFMKDLLVRMEEIIRDLLAREKKKDRFINWSKLKELFAARVMKTRQSLAKRLGKGGSSRS